MIDPDDLRNWADEYDDFDRRAGTLQARHVGGGAAMLREAAAELDLLRTVKVAVADYIALHTGENMGRIIDALYAVKAFEGE